MATQTNPKTTTADILAGWQRLLDMELADQELEPIIAAIVAQATDKAQGLGLMVLRLKAEADADEAFALRWIQKGQAKRGRAAWLQGLLKALMEQLAEREGITEVRGTVNVFLKVSPPSVEVVDEVAIPPEWFKATIETLLSEVPEEWLDKVKAKALEKRAILELHKAGQPLPPGIIIKQGKHILVK